MSGGEVMGGLDHFLLPFQRTFFFLTNAPKREAPLTCEVPKPKHSVCFWQGERVGEVCVGAQFPVLLALPDQSASPKWLPRLHEVLGCCDPLLKSSPHRDCKHYGPVLWSHQSCETLTLKKTHFPLPGPSQPGRRGQTEPVLLQGGLMAPPSTVGVSPHTLSALTSLHACSVSLTKIQPFHSLQRRCQLLCFQTSNCLTFPLTALVTMSVMSQEESLSVFHQRTYTLPYP